MHKSKVINCWANFGVKMFLYVIALKIFLILNLLQISIWDILRAINFRNFRNILTPKLVEFFDLNSEQKIPICDILRAISSINILRPK